MTVVLVSFWVLVAATFALRGGVEAWQGRTRADWTVDAIGLVVQGALIPVLGVTLLLALLTWAAPSLRGAVDLPGWAAFLLSFVLIDYVYYWNHRLLHARFLWPVHAVHHGADRMDVLVTARNTVWTPLFIVYLWANAACLFALADPRGFALGAAITAALDLWRHSTLGPRPGTRSYALLSRAVVTPHDHAWHHSRDLHGVNFGANLSVWDRLHGTWRSPAHAPALGVPSELPFHRRLLWPFPRRR